MRTIQKIILCGMFSVLAGLFFMAAPFVDTAEATHQPLWYCMYFRGHSKEYCETPGHGKVAAPPEEPPPPVLKIPYISIFGKVSSSPYSYTTRVDEQTIPGGTDANGKKLPDIYVPAYDIISTFSLIDHSADVIARKGGLGSLEKRSVNSSKQGIYNFCTDKAVPFCLEHDWTYGLSALSLVDSKWRADLLITSISQEEKLKANPVMTVNCVGGPTDPSFCGKLKPSVPSDTGKAGKTTVINDGGIKTVIKNGMICYKKGTSIMKKCP